MMHVSFPAVFPSLTGQYNHLLVPVLIRLLLMTLALFVHTYEKPQKLRCDYVRMIFGLFSVTRSALKPYE